MSDVIIPVNAFQFDEVLNKGQAWFVQSIAKAGADGIEIRRELFPNGSFPLKDIKKEIVKYKLFTVYSAPIELWSEDGSLNKITLQQVFTEAVELGASWLKVSLGHYHEGVSDCLELKRFIERYESVQLIVENDQTMYGGNIEKLASFFKYSNHQYVPVKMTFDIGNWYYTGQDVENALVKLSNYVCYIHLKHVVRDADGLKTVPILNEENAEWTKILRRFSVNLMIALEFPLKLNDIQKYIEMVRLQQLMIQKK
ncbi:TIM barrel protein [Aquibacillus halophilus]|uniref:TIM barrel protein n=1 Tax=Aquibacillus halophilus TaxID=930132 RepID=A0A6A8DFK2_9BACI|nr:TIM barrel protein [Aquibacillus halophilus]MRH44478.1 TIM barrel protein [Aquibacillus halophilus]